MYFVIILIVLSSSYFDLLPNTWGFIALPISEALLKGLIWALLSHVLDTQGHQLSAGNIISAVPSFAMPELIDYTIINYLWAIPLRRCLAKMWHQHTSPSITSRLDHIAEKEAGQAASYVHWPGIAGTFFAPMRQWLLTHFIREKWLNGFAILLLPAPYLILSIYIPLLSILLNLFLPHPILPLPGYHFRFFNWFMDTFLHVFLFHSIYTCTYMIISTESMAFDRFFGVKPAARAR